VFVGDLLPQVGACGAGDAILAVSAHQLVLLPAMARLLLLDRHTMCHFVICKWVAVVKDMLVGRTAHISEMYYLPWHHCCC
jgi:hypothetical protein